MNNLDKLYLESGSDALSFSKGYVDYLVKLLGELDHQKIAECIALLDEARENDNTIFIIGNGGSASTASHIGNDFGFDMVFSRQVEALGRKGDVCIGLSTSGHSANVIRGLERARIKGCKTIGFTGREGGNMPEVSDICIIVPSDITSRIQEMHLLMGHTLVHLVESRW